MKRVLVLAGGGVRGVMQLETLRFLEKHFGKRINQIYDMIVGTSVGAISGGILATGLLTMEEYSEKFIEFLPNIFKTQWWRVFGLFKTRYDRENFFQMWRNFFGDKDLRMMDCKTKFVCTAINLCDNKTYLFRSWDEKVQNDSLPITIAKSFAAPYYFGQMFDEINKAVWIDGGVGGSNCPLDWAFAEAIQLGWMEEDIEITMIGTGDVNHAVPYEKITSGTDLRQILSYMDPLKGGLARVQSTLNQIKLIQVFADTHIISKLNVFDLEIPPKYEPIDKVSFLNQYLYYGKLLATQVAHHFHQTKTPDQESQLEWKSDDISGGEKLPTIQELSHDESIVIYLDLFSDQLKLHDLLLLLLDYMHILQNIRPSTPFNLFFFKRNMDPYISPSIQSREDLQKILNIEWQERDPTESNFENGLIYCFGYFSSLFNRNFQHHFRLIILSDLPSNWEAHFTMSLFDLIDTMKGFQPIIDIVRFGKKEMYSDEPKLRKLTRFTRGKLHFVPSKQKIKKYMKQLLLTSKI